MCVCVCVCGCVWMCVDVGVGVNAYMRVFCARSARYSGTYVFVCARERAHARVASNPFLVGCLIFAGLFPQKSPIFSSSFAERVLQLKASYAASPTCTLTYYVSYVYSMSL